MNTAEEILVVFLSTALAVFLFLSIIIAIQVYRLLKVVRNIADKTEQVVDTAEQVGSIIKNVSGPLGVINMVKNIVEVTQHKRGKRQ